MNDHKRWRRGEPALPNPDIMIVHLAGRNIHLNQETRDKIAVLGEQPARILQMVSYKSREWATTHEIFGSTYPQVSNDGFVVPKSELRSVVAFAESAGMIVRELR